MALNKFTSSTNDLKKQASQKKGADIPDGKHKWRIRGMMHSESTAGDRICIDVDVVSSMINDKLNREHQGKLGERVYFMPADNETRSSEALAQFFKDLKVIFGKMPEGDLNDDNFKKWAADIRGLIVTGKKAANASSKDPNEFFININFNEKSALTPEDLKVVKPLGTATAASPAAAPASSTAQPAAAPAPEGDLEDDIPF